MIRTSYFALLFIVENSKHSAYSAIISSGLIRIRPALAPKAFDEPFTCRAQKPSGRSALSLKRLGCNYGILTSGCSSLASFKIVNSTMKFSNI